MKTKNIFFFAFLQQEELIHLKTIPNSLAVFCLATYGEGDPTDNAMEYIEWLKNGDGDLTGLNYAVCTYVIIIVCKPSVVEAQLLSSNYLNYFVLQQAARVVQVFIIVAKYMQII